MKTDILLIPMGARYDEMRAAAIAVEEAGFDGLWTWDHLRDPDGNPTGVPEALTALTGLAEATHRIALGPLVLNVGTRHPGLLANMAATLQQVSGGRLLLGIGAGGGRPTPYPVEQEMLGLPIESDPVRRRRVVETIRILRQLWSGGQASFDGRHYRLDQPSGYLRPDPSPPIIVGGFGPKMAALAGRYGDGFNTQALHPRLTELVDIARTEHAAAGGDPQRFVLTVFAGMNERWLRRDSRERAALDRLGIERLILLLRPPFDVQVIREAGRLNAGDH